MTLPKIEIGDKIHSKGITVTVGRIIDQWTDRSMGVEFYCFEGYDTKGEYRSWKQYYDGGELIKSQVENKAAVADAIGNLLRLTEKFQNLDTCKYVMDEYKNEYIIITGKPDNKRSGWKYKVNVNGSSAIAMVQDVLRQTDSL